MNQAALPLDTPFALTPSQIEQCHRDGFIKLKNVLSPEEIAHYEKEITRKVLEESQKVTPPVGEGGYGKPFIQIGDLCYGSEVIREFVFSKKLARIAAELMGVRAVRLYQDLAFYKEPGDSPTKRHRDSNYWPLDTGNAITAWIPLQAVPLDMGPLAFVKGSHLDETDPMDETPLTVEPFDLGEVSYHYSRTIHAAKPNHYGQTRKAITISYFEEGTRIKKTLTELEEKDRSKLLPNSPLGQVINDPKRPVLWTA